MYVTKFNYVAPKLKYVAPKFKYTVTKFNRLILTPDFSC